MTKSHPKYEITSPTSKFDAIIKRYELDQKDPALLELSKIVRGADTSNRSNSLF
jgi:hypothetical protein